jgi:hypothetical protein
LASQLPECYRCRVLTYFYREYPVLGYLLIMIGNSVEDPDPHCTFILDLYPETGGEKRPIEIGNSKESCFKFKLFL